MTQEALLIVKGVDFEIDKNCRNIGIFSLRIDRGSYYFEWIPDPERRQDELVVRNVPKRVVIPLAQLTEVHKLDATRGLQLVTVLVCAFSEKKHLPRFIFQGFADLTVTHLMEYLAYLGVVRENPARPLTYQMLVHEPARRSSDELDRNYVSLDDLVDISKHNEIMRRLKMAQKRLGQPREPVTLERFYSQNLDFSELKREIFESGLSPEARPYVWAVLFGAVPYKADKEAIDKHMEAQMVRYLSLHRQHELLTEEQINVLRVFQDIERVIVHDVKRNDRNTDAFRDDDSPYLAVLERVLIAYAVFNKDTGYVQGMNDLVSPLLTMFVVRWEGDKAAFYDGSIRSMREAESFVFWNFVGMMEQTQHERLFIDLAINQSFVARCAGGIASAVHPPLASMLKSEELTDVSFLFRPMILMYKRAFQDNVFRLWDSLFTSSTPPCYIRFVSAAILILLFPKLILYTNKTLGDVLNCADEFLAEVNVDQVISLTAVLIRDADLTCPPFQKLCESIRQRGRPKTERPRLFSLK